MSTGDADTVTGSLNLQDRRDSHSVLNLPGKLAAGLSMPRTGTISSFSCASAAQFESPPRARLKEHLPAITISSSTTSNILLLETISRNLGLDVDYHDGEDHADEDQLYFDEVLVQSANITTSDAYHSPLAVLEIGPSFEDAVTLPPSIRVVEPKGRELFFRRSLDKFGKRLTLRLPGGRSPKSPYLLMDELEDLASLIKAMESPTSMNSSSPPIAVTNDPVVGQLTQLAKEEIVKSVIGLGIRVPGDDGDFGREQGMPWVQPISEPSPSLKCRLNNMFDSFQKSTIRHARLFSPAGPPPSPFDGVPGANGHSIFTRTPQSYIPVEHVVVQRKSKSAPSSPAGLLAASGDFVRKSLDIITPRPRLPSATAIPPAFSSHTAFPLSSVDLGGLATSTKFYSLRNMVKRRH